MVIVLASVCFTVNEVWSFRRDMNRQLSSMAKAIGINSIGAVLFNDRGAAVESLAAMVSQPNVRASRLRMVR